MVGQILRDGHYLSKFDAIFGPSYAGAAGLRRKHYTVAFDVTLGAEKRVNQSNVNT